MKKLTEWFKAIHAGWILLGVVGGFAVGVARIPAQVAANSKAIKTLTANQEILADNQWQIMGLVSRQLCLDVAERSGENWRTCLQQDVDVLIRRYSSEYLMLAPERLP